MGGAGAAGRTTAALVLEKLPPRCGKADHGRSTERGRERRRRRRGERGTIVRSLFSCYLSLSVMLCRMRPRSGVRDARDRQGEEEGA